MNRAQKITPEMLKRATDAVVATHDEEMRAYLRGEVEANVWRPERYAEAAVRAALDESQREPFGTCSRCDDGRRDCVCDLRRGTVASRRRQSDG